MSGFEVAGGQGLLASASDGSLPVAGHQSFAQENVQYAQYGNAGAQIPADQQHAYAYQQQASYAHENVPEGQQYAGKLFMKELCVKIECCSRLDQQAFDQQSQQGNGFAQNVQYQTIPQYTN